MISYLISDNRLNYYNSIEDFLKEYVTLEKIDFFLIYVYEKLVSVKIFILIIFINNDDVNL